ncbi:hypothetical protein WJX84_000087 [Apatococcus fuscideae]|uniref:Uncharacterized protein n=1 Tax=Apatococcus fuscideae TaxID=2026836 RepID=A0AAW1SMG0_9CHLO
MMVSARLSVGGQRGPSQMAHLPTAEEARLHWLHGYAAAWLGLEAAQEEAGTAKKRVSKVAKARQPPRQLARVCPRPDGSRLPAPPLWPLLDIHPAPQAAPASQEQLGIQVKAIIDLLLSADLNTPDTGRAEVPASFASAQKSTVGA